MPKHAKIPLAAIKALTLRDGRMTTHRRVKAVRKWPHLHLRPPSPSPLLTHRSAQLQCTGSLCAYAPDTVQCANTGDDGAGGVQWRCEADLPQGIKFGDLDVVCEGWGKAGDSNVLAGKSARPTCHYLQLTRQARVPSNSTSCAPTRMRAPGAATPALEAAVSADGSSPSSS